jgi:hypothetical protein
VSIQGKVAHLYSKVPTKITLWWTLALIENIRLESRRVQVSLGHQGISSVAYSVKLLENGTVFSSDNFLMKLSGMVTHANILMKPQIRNKFYNLESVAMRIGQMSLCQKILYQKIIFILLVYDLFYGTPASSVAVRST